VSTPPHILTVPASGWPTLACPHDPPTLDMDCASLVPCFCEDYHAPCPESPTGNHEYAHDGDALYHPAAECWAVHYGDLDEALDGRDIAPGTYEVWPTGEDDGRMYLAINAPKVGAR
jgi:hypothetical protein